MTNEPLTKDTKVTKSKRLQNSVVPLCDRCVMPPFANG
jgi:hypothetical protein